MEHSPEKLEFPARLSALRQKKCGNYRNNNREKKKKNMKKNSNRKIKPADSVVLKRLVTASDAFFPNKILGKKIEKT